MAIADILHMVKILIENGADVNAYDGRGWSAINACAHTGNLGILRVLNESGADMGHPIEEVVGMTSRMYGATPLMQAIGRGNVKFCEALLATGRSNPSFRHGFRPTAHEMARRSRTRDMAIMVRKRLVYDEVERRRATPGDWHHAPIARPLHRTVTNESMPPM